MPGQGGPRPPPGGGLNSGEPIEEGGDLFGTTVQLAARITDRAEPGQILVGNVVRELCAGKRPEFESRGAAALKGFDQPATVFEVIGFEVIGFEVIGREVAD